MTVATLAICVGCEVQLDEIGYDLCGYVVEDAAFGFDDVVCLACIDRFDYRRCECCADLTPGADLAEDPRTWNNEVCSYCLLDCRSGPGCQVLEDRQRRSDAAGTRASELSEVRDMLKRSSQWIAERNKRPSEL